MINKQRQRQFLRVVTHAGSLLPLALLLWDYWFWQFGADPIREITLRTGKAALVLLVLSLTCTPLNIWFGWKQAITLRKPLGLYAFLYVCLHLLTFVWLDYGLDLLLIREAIFEKRFALVGFVAFLLLVPLAATSSKWAMRTLGKNWKRLHRLVYVVAVLALVHYFWLVKNVYTQPVIFSVIVLILFLSRVKPVKQRIAQWRRRLKNRRVDRPASAD